MAAAPITPLFAATAAFLLLAASGLGAATYFVSPAGDDTAKGTAAAPWKTLAASVAKLRPGDTLHIGPGDWKETLRIGKSGQPGRRLTITGQRGTRLSGPGPTVVLTGSRWITIENLTAAGGIISTGPSRGLVIRGNRLVGGGTGEGVRLDRSDGSMVERNRISGFADGIVVSGRSLTVRNNVVQDNRQAGIVLGALAPAVRTLVRSNTLEGNGASEQAPGGLWIRYAERPEIEANLIAAGPGRNLLTVELLEAPPEFQGNFYFSPNGLHGAPFVWEGARRTGFSGLRLVTRDDGARFADPLFSDRSGSLSPDSPAIDCLELKPEPGEEDLAGRPRVAGFARDAGAVEYPFPARLVRSGNQITAKGSPIRLRGAGIGDPLLELGIHPPPDYLRLRREWNANAVRISIHPYIWRQAVKFGARDRVVQAIATEIRNATDAGLYVILDWHITGWPDGFARPSDPGEPPGLHDSSFELACDFWTYMSRAFGKNGAVAFEIWNEPVRGPEEWKPRAEEWRMLRPYWDTLIRIIRAQSDNLIIVAGGSWAYSLKGIREMPPEDGNIAYSWHVYAGKENNDETRWAAAFDDLSRDHPVIVSEWGFDQNGAAYYRGGISDFGEKFAASWLEGRNLHWLAWCFHDEIAPAMLMDDKKSPTEFGRFVQALLQLNPPEDRTTILPRKSTPGLNAADF